MPIKNFEELEIWQDAHALTKAIYQLTRETTFSKDFGLRDQIRRASVSIMSNIAEGFERAAIGNLPSSYMSPKDRAGKCVRSSTWQWIKAMSIRRSLMICKRR
jgi:hypothetical protein